MSMGKIVIIVAPSGTGKSTLIKRLKEEVQELTESVSYTTRPVREGEVDGEHYFFVSEKDFLLKKENNEFLEDAVVHGNFYGTDRAFVEQKLNEGVNLLFDLDVQGADSFKEYFKEKAKAIFISPPSLEVLESRLRGRGTDAGDVIERRLTNAKKEMLRKDDFDYCVYNDELEKAYSDLKSVVKKIIGI